MKIELSGEQLSLVLNALSALAENAEYENAATDCADIHEANDETIGAVDVLIRYIYKEAFEELCQISGG